MQEILTEERRFSASAGLGEAIQPSPQDGATSATSGACAPWANGRHPSNVQTNALQAAIGPLDAHRLIVFRNRGDVPGVGKATLATQLWAQAALHQAMRVAVFCVEMNTHQVIERAMALLGASPESADFDAKARALSQDMRVFIEPCKGGSFEALRKRARDAQRYMGRLDLIVIDSPSLLQYEAAAGEEGRSDIGAMLRMLACEQLCCVMAIAGFNSQSNESLEKACDVLLKTDYSDASHPFVEVSKPHYTGSRKPHRIEGTLLHNAGAALFIPNSAGNLSA